MADRFHRGVIVLCWLVGAALVATSFRLARTNRALASQVTAFYRSIELPEGARVPPLIGFGHKGRELIIDSTAEERPVLLLVFSPTCRVCDKNWPSWYPLVALQREQEGKIVSVDLSGAVRDEYLEAHRIDQFSVVDSVTDESNMAYRFRFTPQTLILRHGKVAAGWMGLLTDEDVMRAERVLRAR